MINEQATMLIQQELDRAKNASIGIGVITKDQKWVTGQIYDDIGETGIGDCIFEIGSSIIGKVSP